MAEVPLIGLSEAFSSQEPWPEDLLGFYLLFEKEAACFHEAGHAVASHQLGLGLSGVEVTATRQWCEDDPTHLGVAFSGRAGHALRLWRRNFRRILAGDAAAALREGIATLAGGAAEFRYRRDTKSPQRLKGATDGDLRHLLMFEMILLTGGDPPMPIRFRTGGEVRIREQDRFRSRDRAAFRRKAWREALKGVHREEVWRAITDLAEALGEELDDGWSTATSPGFWTGRIDGRRARAVIDRAMREGER